MRLSKTIVLHNAHCDVANLQIVAHLRQLDLYLVRNEVIVIVCRPSNANLSGSSLLKPSS